MQKVVLEVNARILRHEIAYNEVVGFLSALNDDGALTYLFYGIDVVRRKQNGVAV